MSSPGRPRHAASGSVRRNSTTCPVVGRACARNPAVMRGQGWQGATATWPVVVRPRHRNRGQEHHAYGRQDRAQFHGLTILADGNNEPFGAAG